MSDLVGNPENRFSRVAAHAIMTNFIYFQGILSGMQKNLHNKHVQISGSASLFYLVKGDQKHRITQKQRRQVLTL